MDDRTKWIVFIGVAMVTGNLGSLVNAVNPNVRYDPWTGTQQREYADKIEMRLDDIASRCTIIELTCCE